MSQMIVSTGPYRLQTEVQKFHDGIVAGEPDELVIEAHWYEQDGTSITDEARVAVLEERLAARAKEEISCP